MIQTGYTKHYYAGTERLATIIGGLPKTDKDGARQYVVYSYKGSLFVRGLVAGDRITVYSQAGKLIHQAVASGYEYSPPSIRTDISLRLTTKHTRSLISETEDLPTEDYRNYSSPVI